MRNQKRFGFVLASVALLASCFAEWRYDGDGQLVDHGMWEANHRYVLDLGKLDLSDSKPRRFRMSRLPEREFVSGLLVTPRTNDGSLPEDLGTTLVSVRVADSKGDVIMSVSKRLREWTRTSGFDYADAFLYGGDDAPSWFTPVNGDTYWLTVSVSPDSAGLPSLQAHVVLRSGGWK